MLGFKGNAFVIEENRHRTVIDLVGDREGGVVVIGGADEPDVLLDVEFAVDNVLRVIGGARRNEVDVPFQGVNIVVTEYTDGSRSTSKMLRK